MRPPGLELKFTTMSCPSFTTRLSLLWCGLELLRHGEAAMVVFKSMESPQSVVSPFNTSSVYPEPEKHNLDHFARNPSFESKKPEPKIGVLEVYIHQAREIQNICIYHKQDVYAKICLTSHPENSVTTQTINGGGQNPVFNQTLSIDVPTVDSSLKCEIYMLSRVRNYLEDQLLGFALIPLSEVFVKNGKLEKEFSLSSNDIFHSPSGFVQLSLSYNGASPDVIAIRAPEDRVVTESDRCVAELGKLEFPDPKIANENQMMVSEYFGMSSESLVSSDTDDQASSENGGPFVSETRKPDSPPTSVSTNGSQCDSVPVEISESESSENPAKSSNQESDSPPKDKPVEVGSVSIGDSGNKPVEVGSLGGGSRNKPVEVGSVGGGSGNGPVEVGSGNGTVKVGSIGGGSRNERATGINIEMDQKVVQQDFVDLYMKSMQQFTESLAKMTLPMEMENEQTSSGNSSTDQNTQTPNGTRPRIKKMNKGIVFQINLSAYRVLQTNHLSRPPKTEMSFEEVNPNQLLELRPTGPPIWYRVSPPDAYGFLSDARMNPGYLVDFESKRVHELPVFSPAKPHRKIAGGILFSDSPNFGKPSDYSSSLYHVLRFQIPHRLTNHLHGFDIHFPDLESAIRVDFKRDIDRVRRRVKVRRVRRDLDH
ncbi:hypothetical protein OSB04_015394 [Centaurea solstitialis]|uniref:C2 domain-containing protein n=1 Tax=Centaurea solstitialis TaxID=347529 RepID=A0AA38T0J9_9ASTR|nr:hypothetical protein OSB04_015394 [Centaurea solstitialis]